MNVLYITNVPSPYRVKYFNELSSHCSLTVVYERGCASDRDKKWVENNNNKYVVVFLKGINYKNDFIISSEIKKYLKNKKYDLIVFCDYASPTGLIGINYCIRRKIPYFIECDGAFYRKSIRDWIKKRPLMHAELCFSTCDNMDDYYHKLGVENKKIVRYRFTSLTNKELENNSKRLLDVDVTKKQLEIEFDKVILFVGQFIDRKGLDLLLKALIEIPDNVGLVAIGGKPDKKLLNIVRENKMIDRIKFLDFMNNKEMSKYFKIADYFVLPTREDIWGLVVNEALSYGLPVLTTNRCNAGLTLIENGINGYIVERDSSKSIKDGITRLLSEKSILRESCIKSVSDWSIEGMVEDHMKVFYKYGK